jgi:hypothetical protein
VGEGGHTAAVGQRPFKRARRGAEEGGGWWKAATRQEGEAGARRRAIARDRGGRVTNSGPGSQ